MADFGGERAGEILFEREGLRRDYPACGTTWEGSTADAAGGAGGSSDAGCLTPWDGQALRLYNADGIFPTLAARARSGLNMQGVVYPVGPVPSLCARADSSPFVDRGQPFVAHVFEPKSAMDENWAENNVKNALRAEGSKSGHAVVYALAGNVIDRDVKQNGAGVKEDTSYTLNTVDRHGVVYPEVFHTLTATNARCAESAQQPNCTVYRQVAHGEFGQPDGTASPVKARDYKGGTVDVCLSTLHGKRKWIVRRLTPLECCRLQGFPDWWEDGAEGSDSARYKMWGNGMALPCVLYVMQGVKEALEFGR